MSEYLSAQEVADKLNVSLRSIRRHIKTGKLRSHKIGKLRRISIEDFTLFAEGRKRKQENQKLIDEMAAADWAKAVKWMNENMEKTSTQPWYRQSSPPVLSMGSR